MNEYIYAKMAGNMLRRLISENYNSQMDFAYDYGAEIRTVNRWINEGINKIDVVESLARFFGKNIIEFFQIDESDQCAEC